jgi:hypothetical protein
MQKRITFVLSIKISINIKMKDMKKLKISKERREYEKELIFFLRYYWQLRGNHFRNIDETINFIVEKLKEKI